LQTKISSSIVALMGNSLAST